MRMLNAFLVVCASTLASVVQARDLTVVVGFAAGGTSTVAARLIAYSAAQIDGISIVVENIPTAGGKLAATRVIQSESSRVLLAMSATSLLRIPPDSGLVPIGIFARYRYVVVVSNNVTRDLSSYMAAAKADRRPRNVATAGAGSIAHLIGERLFADHGVGMIHVPYPGSAPAIRDVLGGHIDLAVVPMPDAMSHRAVLQMIAESGNGITTHGWIGLYGPPAIAQVDVARLAALFEQASIRVSEGLRRNGFEQVWLPGTELRRAHEHDYALWRPELDRLGIEP